MPFKINISDKGKTAKLETDTEFLEGKKIGDKMQGEEIKAELGGYELEITGTSDKAGFPGKASEEGIGLKRVLLTKGWGMKSRPRKEGKRKKRRMPKGLRLRKTVRGNTISKDTIQINLKVIKSGSKKLEEVFPKPESAEQALEKETPTQEQAKPKQEAKPQKKAEEKKEEVKEESKKEEKKE